MEDFEDKYKKIWITAIPFQDFRDDEGHAEEVTKFAKELVERENLDPNIVIPATILHDIGWSKLTEKDLRLIRFSELSSEKHLDLIKKHEEEGTKLAYRILRKLHYPEYQIQEILEIISGHDTRESHISQNDAALRDANRIWKYIPQGFANQNKKKGTSYNAHLRALSIESRKEDTFHFEYTKDHAFQMLESLKSEYLPLPTQISYDYIQRLIHNIVWGSKKIGQRYLSDEIDEFTHIIISTSSDKEFIYISKIMNDFGVGMKTRIGKMFKLNSPLKVDNHDIQEILVAYPSRNGKVGGMSINTEKSLLEQYKHHPNFSEIDSIYSLALIEPNHEYEIFLH